MPGPARPGATPPEADRATAPEMAGLRYPMLDTISAEGVYWWYTKGGAGREGDGIMAQQFNCREMIDRWNAGDDSVLDLAREIVADSKAATRAAEAHYQKASVVWHAGMTAQLSNEPARYMDLDTMTWVWVAPDVDIEALRVAKDQAKAALDGVERPLFAAYTEATVFLNQIEAADARARAADEIALTERIAYGER